MIPFLFQSLIGLIIVGLFWYLAKYIVAHFGLPQPVIVIIGAILLIMFLYWAAGALPQGGFPRLR